LGSTVREGQRSVVAATTERSDLADGVYWEHGAAHVESLHVDRTPPRLTISLEGEGLEHAGPDATAALARRLCERVPGARLTHPWSGPTEASADGLPYIGAIAPRQFAALGLGDNDVTFGTLAGMMAADAVSGKISPWRDRFGFDRRSDHRDAPLRAASSA
jgi:glycine/D-amino acid oxidase-like deaminating enzyme